MVAPSRIKHRDLESLRSHLVAEAAARVRSDEAAAELLSRVNKLNAKMPESPIVGRR